MQQTHLTIDGALGARLNAYRQTLLHADAQPYQAPQVRMPDRQSMTLSTTPGEGLRAAGMLLAYALLGREDPQAEALMQQAEQHVAERQLRRLCTLSMSMLQDDAAFSLPSLLACLRTAIAFLPEGEPSDALPGLVQEDENASDAAEETMLAARFAWADDAAIAYFTLPDGCKKAVVDGKAYTAAQCRSGICLAPGADRVSVSLGGRTATLLVEDPWRSVRVSVAFQLGPIYSRAANVPQRLWRRLPAWVCLAAPAGMEIPALRLITSQGEAAFEAQTIPETGLLRLRCPAIDPLRDPCVQLACAGMRYIDITGED